MTAAPLAFDGQMLLCPSCGGDCVHIDDAYVLGRPRESEAMRPVHVNHKGHVSMGPEVDGAIPIDPVRGKGRRHTMSLVGWCEGCGGRFAITFMQHKGNTFVSTLASEWRGIAAD